MRASHASPLGVGLSGLLWSLLTGAAAGAAVPLETSMSGSSLHTILTDPLAVATIALVLFLCLAPLLAGAIRKARKRRHRRQIRALLATLNKT
jgi:hypothetical protein